MRTFAHKQKPTQKAKSASSTGPSRALSGQGREVIHHLQRTIGNQAVQRLLQTNSEKLEADLATTTSSCFGHNFSQISVHAKAPTNIQPKLTVSTPGDMYEHEANHVADQIMRMPEPKLLRASCGGEHPKCQSKTENGRQSDAVPATASPIVNRALHTSGQPLDASTQTFMESRFGHDFSHVRVHTGREAAESARQLGARAYTLGSHIAFGVGEYVSASNSGQKLIAHELAHVIQQDGGRSAGVVQRAETDDRSCAGLTDIKSDINTKVISEIAKARTNVGTSNISVFLNDVRTRLGAGAISPMEYFIEHLPATKRTIPPNNLVGTKYSGVDAVNRFYKLQTFGLAHVVGSSAKINGICVGADKLGHFFNEGHIYYRVLTMSGGSTAKAESTGRALEIGIQGLQATGVLSNADTAANKAGMQFYKDLAANPAGLTFDIKNYATTQWNEQTNPSFYASSEGKVVWNNLLTGAWKGPFTGVGSTSIDSKVALNATTAGVTGTYEWPAAKPTNKGKIKNGTITQKTTSISGTIPGRAPVSATPVTGVSIDFQWEEKKSTGKGKYDSVNEQTLVGTWGNGSSRTNGGTWNLKKL